MTNSFRFNEYSLAELKDCAMAFVDPLLRNAAVASHDVISPWWTEIILDWFYEARAQNTVVDARLPRRLGAPPGWRTNLAIECANYGAPKESRGTRGEFLFDLAHSSYPADDQDYWKVSYWDRTFMTSPRILLALESEWGKANAGTGNSALVMHDAIKLLHASALAKVVLFASTDKATREETVRLATKLVRNDLSCLGGVPAAWLWIDVPWAKWVGHAPTWWVGEAGAAELTPRDP